MAPWEPDFVPGVKPIRRAVVWLRMPGLPLEFWRSSLILAIVAKAGKPVVVDDFMDLLRKTGYAWVQVEVDTGEPLKSGVLVKGRKEAFWQPFIYENLPMVCFGCGRLGHIDEAYCFLQEEHSSGGGVQPVIVGTGFAGGRGSSSQSAEEISKDVRQGGSYGGRPKLGPWIVTSRIW